MSEIYTQDKEILVMQMTRAIFQQRNKPGRDDELYI